MESHPPWTLCSFCAFFCQQSKTFHFSLKASFKDHGSFEYVTPNTVYLLDSSTKSSEPVASRPIKWRKKKLHFDFWTSNWSLTHSSAVNIVYKPQSYLQHVKTIEIEKHQFPCHIWSMASSPNISANLCSLLSTMTVKPTNTVPF